MLALSSQTGVQSNITMTLVGTTTEDGGAFGSTGSKLIAIFYKQYERRCILLLARAFRRWHSEYPLHGKCDELCRQLKERNNLLENVRGSYLKDVVSIKYHLNQLADVDPHMQIEKYKEKLFDLHHNLPSVDIRDVIEKAKKGWNDKSSQLFRDTLVDSGVIDPETEKTLNSWEQSRSFKRMMRVKRGPSYDYPNAGGESVMLAAPTNHKLFVRYCHDCIGIIALVKNWNLEVEASLKFKADYGRIDEKIEEFKRLIRSLQDIIENKEKDIMNLEARNKELEDAKEWFETWSKMQVAEERKNQKQEQQVIIQNMMAMAEEDKVASLRNLHDLLQLRLEESLYREQELYRQLQYERSERELEVEARIKLADELRSYQVDRHRMAVEIDRLNAARRQDAIEKSQLEHRLENLEKLNMELQVALDVKEAQFEEHRKHTTERINDLTEELNGVTKDLQAKEDEVDHMREELRKQKALIAKQNGDISKLKETIEELKNEMSNMIVPEPKKRSRFRIAVVAIICLFRLAHGIKKRSYKSLGLLGYKVLLKQQEEHSRNMSNERRELHNRIMDMTDAYDDLMKENARLLKIIEELQLLQQLRDEELLALQRQLKEQQEMLYAMQLEKDSLNQLIQNLEANDSLGKVYVEKSMERILLRVKVFVRLQRSVSNELGRIFLQGRGKLQLLNLETFMGEISKEMRFVERLFDGTTSGSGKSAAFTATNALPMVMRKQVYLKAFRGFTEQIKYFFRIQKPLHKFPINFDYQEWMKWILALNIDAFTGKEKQGSNEFYLKKKISAAHLEEKKKMLQIKQAWLLDIKRIDDFVNQVRQCFKQWKIRLTSCGELDQTYRALLEKYNLLLQQKMASDRTVITRQSEKPNNRAKLLKMKGSFTHLLETDISSYLTNVVGAIENVQHEYGLIYSNKGSSAGSGQASGQISGIQSPNRAKSNSFVANANNPNAGGSSTKVLTGNPLHDHVMTDEVSPRDEDKFHIGADVVLNNPTSSGGLPAVTTAGSTKSNRSKPKVLSAGASLHDIAENSMEELHGEESYHEILLPPLGGSGSLVLSDNGSQIILGGELEEGPPTIQEKEVANPQSNPLSESAKTLATNKINKPPMETPSQKVATYAPSPAKNQGSASSTVAAKPSTNSTSQKEKTSITSPSGKSNSKPSSQGASPVKSSRSEKKAHSPKGSSKVPPKSESSKLMAELTDTKQGNVVNASEMDEFANDDDDLLDPDLDGGLEEESFGDELEMMKKEALMFLQHEKRLKTRINEVEEENDELQEQNANLQHDVDMLRREYATFYNEKYKLTKELSKLLREFEGVCHENGLLREMVEDGYRYFSGEKNEILQAMDYFLREQERKRLEALDRLKSQETQVDCVACEMLAITKQLTGKGGTGKNITHSHNGHGGHGHSHGPDESHLNHHAHKFPTAEEYYEKFHNSEARGDDSSTFADVHQNYAKVYGDDVILVPRSRSSKSTKHPVTQSSQDKDKVLPAKSNRSQTPSITASKSNPNVLDEQDLLKEELTFKLRSFRDEYDQYVADQQLIQQHQQSSIPAIAFPSNEGSVQIGGSGGINVSSSNKSKSASFVDHVLKTLSTTENSVQVSELLLGNSASAKYANNKQPILASSSGDNVARNTLESSSEKLVKIPSQLSPSFRPKSSRPTSAIGPTANVPVTTSKSHTKASVAFEQSKFNDSLPQFGSLDITGLDKYLPTSSTTNSAPQSRPGTADKRRQSVQAPKTTTASSGQHISAENSVEDIGNAMYKNQQLFGYAKTFLRPQSAMPLTTPSNDPSNKKAGEGGEKVRPKSGSPVVLAHSNSANQITSTAAQDTATLGSDASKFRKIRQIPASGVGSVTNQSGIALGSSSADSSIRRGISTSSPMLRKLLGGPTNISAISLSGKVASANAAAMAAKKEGRQVSNTAAFLQQNYIKKDNGRLNPYKSQSSRFFDDETTGTHTRTNTYDENDNMDDFILQDHDDDKSFS